MTKAASTIDDVRIEFMTTLEVKQHLEAGRTTIVVPCGAIEQHGPHLPICMDRDHAEHLGARLALQLGDALVAPTLPVGCSAHHLSFAGTISIRDETFEAICRDYCTSLAKHGFKRIIFISGHIGNFPVLARILPAVKAALGDACEIEAFTDSTAWLETWRSAVIAGGGDGTAVGGHADIAETSVMLVLRPDRTHLDRAVAGLIGLMGRDELDTVWRDGLGSVSPNGILGDARGSTAAIGERCIDAITDLLARQFARNT